MKPSDIVGFLIGLIEQKKHRFIQITLYKQAKITKNGVALFSGLLNETSSCKVKPLVLLHCYSQCFP
ncbi:hypothetical protein CWO17_08900 [Vibrio sp. 10N.286.45.A3]|nr:hypothetical protein CWO17_08900 [Vibrio sp. 10N.286.45.A3]